MCSLAIVDLPGLNDPNPMVRSLKFLMPADMLLQVRLTIFVCAHRPTARSKQRWT